MSTDAQVSLTENAKEALQDIAQRTGKSPSTLIQEAVDQLIEAYQQDDSSERLARRRTIMQRAKGLWADRDDLPDFEELRRSWDRS